MINVNRFSQIKHFWLEKRFRIYTKKRKNIFVVRPVSEVPFLFWEIFRNDHDGLFFLNKMYAIRRSLEYNRSELARAVLPLGYNKIVGTCTTIQELSLNIFVFHNMFTVKRKYAGNVILCVNFLEYICRLDLCCFARAIVHQRCHVISE